jgi:branched-chain amino acid transport system substrate-binding protein
MRHEGPEGEVLVRAQDHQLIAPVYIAALTSAGKPGVHFDVEDTGLGWKTVYKAEGKDFVPPLKCRVKRP